MDLPQYIQIVVILICIVFSAYFSATETAFSSFNRIRMKNLAEKGNKKAARVIKLAEKFDTLISTILIGNNIVNILATSLATLLFVHLFVEIAKNPNGDTIGSTVSTAVMTVLVLIFGEISPKTIAKRSPESFALFSVNFINFLCIILFPFSFIFRGWQWILSKIFKSKDDAGMTEEELISIIEEAEEEGGLDEDEGSLIKSAIEFNDLEVSDIFTPRIDITAVPISATKDEIEQIFSESGFSRLPVYDGDIDNILGIIYYKDFFTMGQENDVSTSDIMKPVIYVATTQPINDLLKELQNKQLHMAVVLDEFGSTAGIVTLEDILEEIVGEIWDEHDEKVEEIKKISETEYIVEGMTSISKVFDIFDIDDEEIEASNANGWAMEVLGKLPELGDTFSDRGLYVEILETNGKRVESLKITDVRDSDEEEIEKLEKKSSEDENDSEAQETFFEKE